jgi:predicted MFS family arabinose efflux permease
MKKVNSSSDLIPATACMLLMLQAYIPAPLTPTLAADFSSSLMNLAVPAFIIPFAIAAGKMIYMNPGVDLRKCLLLSLAALCLGTYLLNMTTSAAGFILIRALTGYGTGALLPSALLLAINSQQKRRSLNDMVFVIFAVATGMTFGPSLGGWLNEIIGWRSIYRCINMLSAALFLIYFLKYRQEDPIVMESSVLKAKERPGMDWKRRYVYSFVFITGVFHSGVFVWISHYFTTHYGLDELHLANDLFIFGLPGFLLSLLLYCYGLDKKVITILYSALCILVAGLLAFSGNLPLWLAECLLSLISIGFGCSQPLFIGILKLPRAGISLISLVAKGSGILFAGYGSGPIIMMALLSVDLGGAMLFLMALILVLAYISHHVWKVSGPGVMKSAY